MHKSLYSDWKSRHPTGPGGQPSTVILPEPACQGSCCIATIRKVRSQKTTTGTTEFWDTPLSGIRKLLRHVRNKGMLCLLDPHQQKRVPVPVPCALPTRLAAHGVMPQEHVFMTLLAGRNSRSSQKPAPSSVLTNLPQNGCLSELTLHLELELQGVWEMRVLAFQPFKKVHWKESGMR